MDRRMRSMNTEQIATESISRRKRDGFDPPALL